MSTFRSFIIHLANTPRRLC